VNRRYKVEFEIAAPAAMFTRPDTGSTPISYPAPTYSALIGMFETVARIKSAYIKPIYVEICAPIEYHNYFNNYGGPLREIGKRNLQLVATVLNNVCYKVYGEVAEIEQPPNGNNHLHALQEMFLRRLKHGYFYNTPCLGWREFTPSYFGILREQTTPDKSINLMIPSMLYSMYESPSCKKVMPSYKQNVKIMEGVLRYDK